MPQEKEKKAEEDRQKQEQLQKEEVARAEAEEQAKAAEAAKKALKDEEAAKLKAQRDKEMEEMQVSHITGNHDACSLSWPGLILLV